MQKTEVYSKEELAEKEKEWIEIFEENEKQKILENAKKTENKEKNDKEEQETETKNTTNNEEQEAPESKKPEEIKEEDKTEKNEEQYEKEPKLEIVTPLRRETAVNSAQMDPNFQQFPKLEAFENSVAVEKGLEEELKEANAMLDSSQGYDDVVKKSIAEIFKSKPMDYKKKEKIEKSIRENVRHLENVLKEFGVEAKVVNYEYGPTITRYYWN